MAVAFRRKGHHRRHQAVLKIPKKAWTPAYDAGGTERPGARIVEITDMPDVTTWPTGMRLSVRKERPHPAAQLGFTDIDGNRLARFATITKGGRSPSVILRQSTSCRACHTPAEQPLQPSNKPHHHAGEWNPAPMRRDSRAVGLPRLRRGRTTQDPRQETDESS